MPASRDPKRQFICSFDVVEPAPCTSMISETVKRWHTVIRYQNILLQQTVERPGNYAGIFTEWQSYAQNHANTAHANRLHLLPDANGGP